jgi:hypothetical protein
VKAKALRLLTNHTPTQAWTILWNDGLRNGLTAAAMKETMPTYMQLINMRSAKLKELKTFAALEAQQVFDRFTGIKGEFILDMSLYHKGSDEVFVLMATQDSLLRLVEHGQNIFFMDGMHGINHYNDNQMVTINVKVGSVGFPCAYLITCR